MKIRLIIHNGYVSGGTVRTTLNTAGALAELGHDVEVVSMYRRRRVPAFDVPPGVRLRPLVDRYEALKQPRRPSASRRKRLRWAVTRWLDEKRPFFYTRHDWRWQAVDILGDIQLLRYIRAQRDGVLVGTRPGINLALALWARPEPVVIGQDHLNTTIYAKELKAQFRRCYPRLDALVTLTDTDAAGYTRLLADRTRVLAIPNAVPPLGPWVGSARPEVDSKLVVAAGRIARQKGFDRLLDIWALVAPAHPEWRLEIYGGGPADELRERAEALGIADSAHFMGRSSQLPEIMSRAAMFVMTSRFEGFPMVLLEAMSIGLPVVSYDFPTGARELIEEGRNGYLVPNDDAAGFAARVSKLIEEPDLRRRMGAAATNVKDDYELGVLGRRWVALFEELAVDHGRARRRAKAPWRLRLRESGAVQEPRKERLTPSDRRRRARAA